MIYAQEKNLMKLLKVYKGELMNRFWKEHRDGLMFRNWWRVIVFWWMMLVDDVREVWMNGDDKRTE